MRRSLSCIAMLALAACAAPEPAARAQPPAATAAQAEAARARIVPVAAPAFGDGAPYAWHGRGPDAYPVHGIDVSHWQGAIDWPAARAAGVAFAYIKATEGGDLADRRFAANWTAAARAGIPRGAYHYYYFCRPAEEQARWFIEHVPRDAAALPPVLDMEWTPHSPTCTLRPDGGIVRAEARRFLDILTRHYGQRPVIYTTVDFYRDTGIGALRDTEFWLRSVAGHPAQVYPGADWALWQYTGTGLVPGIDGPVDINTFAGSAAAWARWRN